MTKSPLNILIPVDFTEASELAVAQAALLNDAFQVNLNLLHVAQSEMVDQQMTKLAEIVNSLKEQGVESQASVLQGPVFSTINKTATNENMQLMVIGTHGAQGIRQNLFGADILRLLKGNSCPSLVVQKKTTPITHFKKILLPVGSHPDYKSLTEAVALIAKASAAEVIIYSIERPQEEQNDQLVLNKKETESLFTEKGIVFTVVNEPTNVVSFGFAKQTLLFAEQNQIDMIAIMANASFEHLYFANADKERILVNDSGIAILCSPGV